MGNKLGILFLHHNLDKVTRANLASVRRQNPRARIVTMSAGEKFPDGYNLEPTPRVQEFHARNSHRGSDWLVCSWFLQRREHCEKWWIVEWDTYCEISTRDYYRSVWHFPFVASSVRLPYREPEWIWFRDVKRLPKHFRPYAIGAVPFLYLLSVEAVDCICRTLLKTPLFVGNAELRFATVANFCRLAPCGFSPPGDQITWIERKFPERHPLIFHPVKQMVGRKF